MEAATYREYTLKSTQNKLLNLILNHDIFLELK